MNAALSHQGPIDTSTSTIESHQLQDIVEFEPISYDMCLCSNDNCSKYSPSAFILRYSKKVRVH